MSKQQIHHFQTFGFLVLRKVFDPDEIQTIEREFDHGLDTAYRDKPFDGSARHWVPMLGEETPYFAALLEDPRFCDAAEQLYGDDVIGMACDANRYVGDTRWHPDTGSLHQYGIKFAFYLDPVGPETGALRVLPGSHWPPYHNQLIEAREESRLEIPEVPAFVCASEPGDVVGFDLRLWHASCGGSDNRRMSTLVYYNNPKTPEETEATRIQGQRNADTMEKFGLPDGPIHPPDWLANPHHSRRRQHWIQRMRALEYPGFAEN